MFGFFMFGQPLFADVPRFAGSGGGGGPGPDRYERDPHHARRDLENQIEITLLAFLNTQP